MSASPAAPLFAMRGIRKSFGPVAVLKGVDFILRPGEIHALMGENGAGKSTLMKIAGGIYPEYEGEIRLDGAPVRFVGTRDATAHGIAIIHQELNLVPGMTVADNIFLGAEKTRGSVFVDRGRQLAAAGELLRPLNFTASPARLVGSLRVGEQQLVEIAKALSLRTRILIMDEPTSALSVSEAERLHGIIKKLAGEGVAIVYISHRMEEIFALCDAVTVLRDGALVGTVPIAETSRAGLIRMMAGRDVQEFFRRGEAEAESGAAAPAPARPVLSVRGLWLANPRPTAIRPRLVDGVDFDVAPGEVLGLAGLMGAGRTELLETMFGGRDEPSGGEVRIDGQAVAISSPLTAKHAGLALVTEDRKRDGLLLEAAIESNTALTVMPTLARFGLVSRERVTALAKRTIAQLAIRTFGPKQAAGTLSGGNQQKVVIGKWLATAPRVLLLDEPTRGIDVGAKAEIYRLIRELSAQGIAIVVASSEMPELLALSDRILVLREGRPAAVLGHDEFVADTILDYASPGGQVQPAFAALWAGRLGGPADAGQADVRKAG
ncbi:MAG: sugar ABC transporter ATP-binding protein [Geminicoccaceae bacterium]